jgi:general stress protein YciG
LFRGKHLGAGRCDEPGSDWEVFAAMQDRKMTRAEAGRKGGLTTKQRYGEEFFGKIGRIGGKKGGDTTKKRYGIEFYQRIGRKGGSR